MERGLPTAVKAVGKAVVGCQQPSLSGGAMKKEEGGDAVKKLQDEVDLISVARDGQAFRVREAGKLAEFQDRVTKHQGEWELARSSMAARDQAAAVARNHHYQVTEMERKHRAMLKKLKEEG